MRFSPVTALLACSLSKAVGSVFDEQKAPRLAARASSNITTLTPQFFSSLNSKRVQITYGPYTVPPSTVQNGMKTFLEKVATPPCTDCALTWIQAGLQYPNGSDANANTSLWLHHTFTVNYMQPDAVCGFLTSGERFFASGNERTPINICANGTNEAGYYLAPTDKFAVVSELMNSSPDPQEAVVTYTYEYIQSPPASVNRIKPVWLDIGGCNGSSEQPAQPNTAFEYTSPPWTSNFSGAITMMAGHLHDGGVVLEVNQNNAMICNCTAAYGQNPGYIDPTNSNMNMSTMPGMSMGGGMNMSMTHISSIAACSGGQVNVGDTFSVKAMYNTSEYAAMVDNDGTLAPIMGISLFYVALNETATGTTVVAGTNSSSSTTTTTSSAAAVSSTAAAAVIVAPAAALVGGLIAAVFL